MHPALPAAGGTFEQPWVTRAHPLHRPHICGSKNPEKLGPRDYRLERGRQTSCTSLHSSGFIREGK